MAAVNDAPNAGPGAFADRAALVTGAARGIGFATARLLARRGAAVALVDRDADAVRDAAASIAAEGHRALGLAADVSRDADVREAVAAAVAAHGRLDVLVNNAAISFARALDEYTEAEWDLILGVNLKGAFLVTRAALPALRRTRGSIVNVSSMTGAVGQDHGAAYASSKGALVSFTRSLALELGPDGIRVNCVSPAGVDTELMRAWAGTKPDPDAILRGQAAMHLVGRMATPDEIAEAIAFLASPAASFVTGVDLPVEGGATLGYRRG